MMRVRGGVKTVHRLRGDLQGRGEAEGRIRLDDVVVNGLGQMQNVEARVHQTSRVLGGASPAEAYQGVQLVLGVVLHDRGDHVAGLAVDDHAVDLVPARA